MKALSLITFNISYSDKRDLTMRKILVIPATFFCAVFAQNDGLVKTYYPDNALKTEGNYNNGVRDGVWTFWYKGEVFQDFGEDQEPNTNDPGEGNGTWDSTETVLVDLDGDSLYDPPIKEMEGTYSEGNKEGVWTIWYLNSMRKQEANYTFCWSFNEFDYTISTFSTNFYQWHRFPKIFRG